MTRRNRSTGAPRTRMNTVIGFRLDSKRLASLDALAAIRGLKRAAVAEQIVSEALESAEASGGGKAMPIAEQKAIRQAVAEFKKDAGGALWDVIRKWERQG